MSSSEPDYGEIVFDSTWHYKVDGEVQVSAVDRLAAKITVGDYAYDSNDLLSADIMGDYTGGHGVTDLKEGVDDNRYSFGTLYTRYPNQISLPFSIGTTTLGSGALCPLGDMKYLGVTYRIMSSGANLYMDTTLIGAMAGTPAAGEKAVMFGGTNTQAILYVPTVGGYSAYNPATTTLRNVSAPDVKSFCLWDNKLIALDRVGQLHYAVAGTAAADTTFTSYGTYGKLDPAYQPNSLEVYYNRSGEPAIHVITDENVWIFDPASPRLYPIPDFGSIHPFFGRASAVWRGEMFVAAGMDILAYNGSVVRNLGISRDQGIPYNFQGHVRDLVAGQNSLYALVYGRTTGGVTYHSVHEWSGIGWHCIYADSDANVPGQMSISNADLGGYRLYWGMRGAGTYYYQQLPVSFTNPRAAIEVGAIVMGDFTNSYVPVDVVYNTLYYLETGKFNSNMKGYRKIANAVELDLRSLDASVETVTLKYRIDSNTAWTTLGTTTTVGHNVFQFGALTNSIYPGITFEDIEFRLEVQDAVPIGYIFSTRFVMESMVFSFLPVKNPSLAWTAYVDLTSPHNDQSPRNLYDKLTTLRTQGTFFSLNHQGNTYRVRLSGFSGGEETGMSETRGKYTLQILEIPVVLGITA